MGHNYSLGFFLQFAITCYEPSTSENEVGAREHERLIKTFSRSQKKLSENFKRVWKSLTTDLPAAFSFFLHNFLLSKKMLERNTDAPNSRTLYSRIVCLIA